MAIAVATADGKMLQGYTLEETDAQARPPRAAHGRAGSSSPGPTSKKSGRAAR